MKFPSLIFNEFDKSCATLGILFSTVFIIYTTAFISQPVIYYLTGFLSLISCVIWLLIRKNSSLNFIQIQSHSLCLLLPSIFFVLFTSSVLSFYFRPNLYERPLIYFLLTSLMIGIISLELFLKSIKNSLLLFQILLIGVSIAWSQLLLFPSLVGIDPWGHQTVTLEILNMHNVPDDGSGYSKLPMFHLFTASTSLITGLNYKFATMMSVSFSQVLCTLLLVFLFCIFLFDNYKIGLLASLCVTICNNQILMSYWSTPNGFGTLFVLYSLYCYLKLKNKSHIISTILSIIFMITLILTHTIASLFMSIASFVYFFASKLHSLLYSVKGAPILHKFSISFTFAVLFTVSMFSWWSFVSGDIYTLSALLQWGLKIDFFSYIPQDLLSRNSLLIPVSEQIFNSLAMYSLFGICLIGCFYMISKKYGNSSTFCFAALGLTPMLLVFFTLVTHHSILEQRWVFFAQVFLSVPFAVSLVLVTNSFKNKYLKSGLLFLLIISISFFMIMNPIANVDNHVFSPNTSMTYSLTMSELQAANRISNLWNGTIKTDEYYSGTQQYTYKSNQNYTYKFESFCDEIYRKDSLDLQDDMVLIRKSIIGRPFKMFFSLVILDYDPRDLLFNSYFSKVYNCGSVEGYLKA